ncbi:MAG: hypothetical protein ACYC5N_11625, partial [Endomicrobiales bacterium]
MRTGSDGEQVSYGKVDFAAQTAGDRGDGLVRFDGWNIERVYFPSEPGREKDYLRALRSAPSLALPAVSAGRLKEDLAILREQKKGRSRALRNDPPRVIFSRVPAVLVPVDGDPVFAPVKDTGLSRLVNTQALLLKDGTGALYLRVFDGYMKAGDIRGPWMVSQKTT